MSQLSGDFLMKKIILVLFIFYSSLFAQVKFDANFESGNMNSVSTSDSVNYTVSTKSDIGGRWFYFRITGAKDKFIRVNIVDDKTYSINDVKRAMYSYDNKNFTRFTAAESPNEGTFQTTFSQDTVYVAYYTPYTFSYLQERINEWSQSEYVSVDTLGLTNHNLPIQEIILTDKSVPNDNKYQVWIHARTHPGETPASWHFDGIVQTLLKNDDVIEYYRKNIVFHLIPFTNPDGVYYGRSRTNYDGVDVESNWNETDANTSTEVKILKKRMAELNNEKPFSVFLNLHSQASTFCTMWIHTPGSTSDLFYQKEFQMANLNSSDIPYFAQTDYSQSNLSSVFPEGWQWNNWGNKIMALTYETPYDQYSDGTWVTNDNLFEIGRRTVYAIAEYLQLSQAKYYILDNKDAIISGNWAKDSAGVQFYGNNYLQINPGTGSDSVTFKTAALESGNYDVYAWWPANNSYAYNTKFHINAGGSFTEIEKTQQINGGQWNFLKQVSLSNSGTISLSINNNASGIVAADAFRIIYKGPVSSVKEIKVPKDFILYQNFPNPFNPSTTIRFQLKKNNKVLLRVIDPLGKQVAVLLNKEMKAGMHDVIFNTKNYPSLSSGVYYFILTTDKSSESKGMILLK